MREFFWVWEKNNTTRRLASEKVREKKKPYLEEKEQANSNVPSSSSYFGVFFFSCSLWSGLTLLNFWNFFRISFWKRNGDFGRVVRDLEWATARRDEAAIARFGLEFRKCDIFSGIFSRVLFAVWPARVFFFLLRWVVAMSTKRAYKLRILVLFSCSKPFFFFFSFFLCTLGWSAWYGEMGILFEALTSGWLQRNSWRIRQPSIASRLEGRLPGFSSPVGRITRSISGPLWYIFLFNSSFFPISLVNYMGFFAFFNRCPRICLDGKRIDLFPKHSFSYENRQKKKKKESAWVLDVLY